MAWRRTLSMVLSLFLCAAAAAAEPAPAAAPGAAPGDEAPVPGEAAAPAPADPAATAAERRLEALERQLAALQEEVRALRAEIAADHPGEAERVEAAATGTATTAATAATAATPAAPATPAVPAAPAAGAADAWQVGYREGGGGFFLRSPDGKIEFRQLGYVQFTGGVFHDDFRRADSPGDFSIRRARVDWLADFARYQLFVEFDGGPGSVPGSSDFALVEGKLTADVDRAGTLQVVGGKFVSPFSTENLLSSRSQDTVERYIALNSMFLLPALDVQYGLMLRKTALDERLDLSVGVFNGNGRANDNLSDDNGDKEVQVKLNYHTRGALKLGFGLDSTHEEVQSLQLRGLSFTPWVAVPVAGARRAATADFAWSNGGPLSFRGEGLYADFADSDATLAGGFVQGARFLRGDAVNGVQALLRLETASLDSPLLTGSLGDRLDAVTLGLNWFRGGNFRLQLDAVGERYNGLSTLAPGTSRVEGDGWKPYLLSELQIKF